MKTNVIMLLFCCSIYLNAQYNYPATPVKAVIDNYNGVKITDNYRWLEDMKNPEVKSWFKKQADFSKNYIENISGRDQLFNDMKYLDELKSEEFYNAKKNGNNYFYTKILRGEKVAKLYLRDGAGKEILIFDPEKYVAGKTYEIQDFSPNLDGSILAMGLAESGAEIGESRFIDIKTQKLLPDVLTPVWGGELVPGHQIKNLFCTSNFKIKIIPAMTCLEICAPCSILLALNLPKILKSRPE